MDDFLKLIETLRERMDSHQAALRRNEALTRSVLVDPLLRALGWDTENPAHMIPEYPIRSEPRKQADYALFAGSAVPTIIVEAKSLGAALSEAAIQAVQYCTVDGYKYFAVTDGSHWTLYETHRSAALDEKKIARFDLRSDSPTDVCTRAIALWRQRFVESGSAWHDPAPVSKNEADTPTSGLPTAVPDGHRDLSSEWVPLSGLRPEKFETPQGLRLPSGEILVVATWAQLVAKLTQWLMDDGHLVEANLPIPAGRGRRYLVAEQPKHSDGKPFTAEARVGRFFVETSFAGKNHADNMRTILGRAGMQPGDFAVRTRRPGEGDQS